MAAPAALHYFLMVREQAVGQPGHQRERVIGHGLMIGAEAHADRDVVPGCRRHVDLVVTDPHAGDDFQLGRRGEHPLGIGLAARDRAEYAGQERDQLILGQRAPGPIEGQLAPLGAQAFKHRQGRLVRHGDSVEDFGRHLGGPHP
jgi:hypothetical protein